MKNLGWYLAGLFFLIAVLHRECNSCEPCTQADTVTTTIHVYDSIPRTAEVTKPRAQAEAYHPPVAAIATPAGVTYKPQPVDTEAILHSYYTSRYYRTQHRDSSADIVVEDSVYRNELTWQKITYKLIRPTEIKTTIITPPAKQRAKLFVGLAASAGIVPAAGPDLLFLTKKDNGYRAGIKIGAAKPAYEAAIYWKIKLKR